MKAALVGLMLLLVAAPAPAQRDTIPPPTATHTIDYQEPTMKADGTPLQGLKSIRVYWRMDDGPETVVTLPASSIKGGLVRRFRLTMPATSGVLSVTLTAVDMSGNESAQTVPLTKTIAPPAGKE